MNVDAIKAAYAQALGEFDAVKIRRYTGSGMNRPWFEVECRARVTGFDPNELVGGIQQGDRKVILLHDDLVANGFALPITTNDKVVIAGRECAILAPDELTRRVGGVSIAYQIAARG